MSRARVRVRQTPTASGSFAAMPAFRAAAFFCTFQEEEEDGDG